MTGDLDRPVWSALPVPALVLDAGDRVRAANGPMENLLVRSGKAMTGRAVSDHLDIDGGLAEPLARVRADAAPMTLHDARVEPRGGAAQRADLHIAPMGDGGTLLLVAPREIAGRLDRARTSRAAARSAIGLAEMLAHEVKNPLAGITGAAQLLSLSLSGEDRELTDLIVAETRRILKLLEQVEQFGDLRPPQRRAVNVHDVLDRAKRSVMVGAAAHMEIGEDYDPSLPPAHLDADQMLQAVMNLLTNAAQVGRQGGRITIRTFYEGGLRVRRADGRVGAGAPLQIEVVDDGPGVPPEMLPTLFEPFVSGRENGTGLGLALVAKIVAAHDGLLSVDSRPGRTAFRLSLPRAPREAAPDAKE